MAAKNIQISKIRKYLPKLDPGILDTSKPYVSAVKLFENLRIFVEIFFFQSRVKVRARVRVSYIYCPCFMVMRGVLGVSRCVFTHINPIPKPNQKLLNSETYRNPIQNKKLLNSETYRNPLQNPGNQTATGLPGFWMGFRWVLVGFGRFR